MTQYHFLVYQGVRAEMKSNDIGGDEGKHGEVFPGLRKATSNSYIFQILGELIDGFRLILERSFGKPMEVSQELVPIVEDTGKVI